MRRGWKKHYGHAKVSFARAFAAGDRTYVIPLVDHVADGPLLPVLQMHINPFRNKHGCAPLSSSVCRAANEIAGRTSEWKGYPHRCWRYGRHKLAPGREVRRRLHVPEKSQPVALVHVVRRERMGHQDARWRQPWKPFHKVAAVREQCGRREGGVAERRWRRTREGRGWRIEQLNRAAVSGAGGPDRVHAGGCILRRGRRVRWGRVGRDMHGRACWFV